MEAGNPYQFTFGNKMMEEMNEAISSLRDELIQQMKAIKQTSDTLLQDMEKTKSEYDTSAAQKLASMDKTLMDKVNTMEAKVMKLTQGLVNRVTSLETENNARKASMAELKITVERVSERTTVAEEILRAIGQAASGK